MEKQNKSYKIIVEFGKEDLKDIISKLLIEILSNN